MANTTLTMANYRATARKMHAAYTALKEASENSGGVGIARTLDSMAASFDDLRVEVCTDCSTQGLFTSPENPDWSTTCQHPKVPTFNVRTGEFGGTA